MLLRKQASLRIWAAARRIEIADLEAEAAAAAAELAEEHWNVNAWVQIWGGLGGGVQALACK